MFTILSFIGLKMREEWEIRVFILEIAKEKRQFCKFNKNLTACCLQLRLIFLVRLFNFQND